MIGATRPSTGFSITSRPSASAPSTDTGIRGADLLHNKGLNGALQSLSHNPVLRSLMGESGFDGIQGGKGAGKIDKALKPEKMEEVLGKLMEVIQQLVGALEKLVGQQPGAPAGGEGGEGGTAPAAGTGGGQSAAPTEGAGGAEGAQQAAPTEGAGGAEGAQQAAPTEGAEATDPAAEGNPLEQMLQALKQILQQLQQLQAQLNGGQTATPAAPPATAA